MGNADRPGGDQAATDQATGRRVTVPEAADVLGISEDAVRSRIKRGTLETVRTASRVFVVMGDQPTHERTNDRPTDRPSESNALTSQMQGEIDYLRGQLEAERQAHAEARRIIAGLVERIPPAIEPPAETAPDATGPPEGAEPGSDRGTAPPDRERATERPWWRRIIGGG